MSMEPGTLIRVCGTIHHSEGVYVGIGTSDLFWADGGSVGIVVGPHEEEEEQHMPDGYPRLRRSFSVLIGGQQGWLWDDEFEVIDATR